MGKISLPKDVRSKNDVPAFEKLLEKGPITLVLVYADWCGHCDNYKKNVWSPLQKMKNRTANMASVHYDQLENTSLANSKIDGYPSLLMVGNDKKPATFDGDMGETNAMPNANNMETMKKVVSAPKSVVNNTVSSLNTNDFRTPMKSVSNSPLSPLVSPSNIPTSVSPVMSVTQKNVSNLNVSNISPESNVSNLNVSNISPESNVSNLNVSLPPNIESDVVNSTNKAVNLNKKNKQGTTPLLEGGGLYKQLSYKKNKKNRQTRRRKSSKYSRKN